MENPEQALQSLSEKELLLLNFRVQADILHRIKKLEWMANLIQKHLLPENAETWSKDSPDSGHPHGTYIEMLRTIPQWNCGYTGVEDIDDDMKKSVEYIADFKESLSKK